jgi:methylmalonyl-CoA mutase
MALQWRVASPLWVKERNFPLARAGLAHNKTSRVELQAKRMTDLDTTHLFEPPTGEQWLALVDKVLKGGDFEKRLVARTADGIRINPLYTRADEVPGMAMASPGVPPFTRGGAREQGRWDIRQVHADADPEAANKAILEDLAGGVSSLTLQIASPGFTGVPYDGGSIEHALKDVMLDVCPVHLRAGEYTQDAAGALMALWRKRGIADANCVGGLGADPLGTLAATGALYHDVPKSLEMAARLATDTRVMPAVTALRADGHIFHRGGATEAQELACVLASLVAYLRAMEGQGLAPEQGLPKIAVTLALDADQFLGIAKLRAARTLIWKIADACGAGDAASKVRICAETSERMLARRDPWVNILRTAMACAAGALGGADSVTVLPMTWAMGRPDAFARRVARNVQLVLMEESGLGRVADPAGGSWAVESLTRDLAARAWEIFQQIESKGGMGRALLTGFVQDEIAREAVTRAKKVVTGALQLTGTSAFPRLGDDGITVEPWPKDVLSADLKGATARPLKLHRLAEPFEALRDAADAFAARVGTPPRVFLISLGALAEHGVRTTWTKNFLATGGIDTVASGDGFTASADAGKAFADSGLAVACLCASDRGYAELGEAAAGVLKQAGAKYVLLAGRPRDQEAALKAAGVDAFIYAGADMLASLRRLHDELGISGDR